MEKFKVDNTWCPGCGNFFILEAFKKATSSFKKQELVLVSGIGCHAKIIDYLNINSFYGLHGRCLPLAQGIKLSNPKLKVVCFSGDGDSYNEGIGHLIHAAKRNSDITVIIHDNHTFALTVKQYTSTSPRGFKGSSTPKGSVEDPINPLELMLASGATFIARGYAGHKDKLTEIIKRGIEHKGFSFIEVLQPCIAWNNTFEKYNKSVYWKDFSETEGLKAITEWDYRNGDKIATGVFYQKEKKSFEEEFSLEKKDSLNVLLKNHV